MKIEMRLDSPKSPFEGGFGLLPRDIKSLFVLPFYRRERRASRIDGPPNFASASAALRP